MPTDDEILASLQPDEDRPLSLADYEAAAAPGTPALPSPVAPNPAAAFEAPMEGPPAPSPTDALMAQQPPAPGGIPARDPLQDAVPGVPRETPGNIGAPAPLPGAPGYTPPAADAAPGSTAAVGQSLDEQKVAREAGLAADEKTAEGGQEYQDTKLDAAVQHRQNVDAGIKHAEDIQARYDAADKAAAEQVAQTQAALKGFKFKDYWSDKSAGQRVLSALAVALGGFGAGLTHTPNYALQILDKEMDEDHVRQVEQLKQLSDQDVTAHTGIADARAARTRALADLTMADAQKDRLIAGQLEEAAARSTDANYKNVVAADVAKKREAAAAKDVEAQKMLRTMNLEDQVKAAQIDEMKARAEQARAHAAGTGGFVPRHGKTAGGGGGAGGGALATNAGELAKRIRMGVEENGTRRPLTQDEAIAAAAELHIPLNGKPSQTTLTSIMAGSKFNAEEARKDHRAGIADDRLLSKEAESWKKSNGIDSIAKTQRELGAVLNEVKTAPHNPLQQALAVEKAVSAARGGAASKQALQLALNHLGGKWDSIESMVQGARNGELGQAQMDNFIGFINNQLGTAQKEGKDAYDGFNKYIESQPAEKRAALTGERGRIFSGLHGFGGKAEGGGGSSPELVAKARAAVNDPSRAPAVRAAAQKIIDQAGASGG